MPRLSIWTSPGCSACYPSQVIGEHSVRSFTLAALSPDPDLAIAALMIARLAYPKLDAFHQKMLERPSVKVSVPPSA